MKTVIRAAGGSHGRASDQLLSNNIEAYEDTFPSMLSDRLRNSKFSGPENLQTGVAARWEPLEINMRGFACRLVPGMYLSGREAQLIHVYAEQEQGGIVQEGVHVRPGEEFEVEIWARVQHRPVTVSVELTLPGQQVALAGSAGQMTFDQAHWERKTCRVASPGIGDACFKIKLPGDSRLVIDQVHLRPAGQSHVSPALLEAMSSVPCPVLRFPGGCISCTYHWEHGVGPVHLRPVCDDPVFKYKVHYDFGTDEYLDLCAARNIRPFITLNTSTATPEQAAAWAAYVRNWHVGRGQAVPAAYFMFGNENYATHEIGHMTPEMYVAQLRRFVPPVRAAYPEARMLALGEFESAGLRIADKAAWRSVVMEKAADLLDMLVLTRYSWSPGDYMPLQETMECIVRNLEEKEADLQYQAQSIRDAKLNCMMGIVEWNYWTRASHHDHAGFYEPNDIRHCLYAAGYLNAFCRMGEILEVANFDTLVNAMGMIQLHDGRAQLTDMVKVFQLYADALPGDVLRLAMDAPPPAGTGKVLDANFIRKGGATYGFLVNFSATETLEISLEGLGAIRHARGLSSSAILTPVTEFPPAVAAKSVTLPPMSLVRVESGG